MGVRELKTYVSTSSSGPNTFLQRPLGSMQLTFKSALSIEGRAIGTKAGSRLYIYTELPHSGLL